MTDSQVIYSIFNFVNESSIWIGILNSIVSIMIGGWIVYKFNVKIEKTKNKELHKVNYENLKNKLIGTIEELKLVGTYIAEYNSKGEYQIAVKEISGYFNENLYNIRLSNYDLFRIKFAEIRSQLIKEVTELEKFVILDETYFILKELTAKSTIPSFVPFSSENIRKEDNSLYTEQEVEQIIIKTLLMEGRFLNTLNIIKNKIEELKYNP